MENTGAVISFWNKTQEPQNSTSSATDYGFNTLNFGSVILTWWFRFLLSCKFHIKHEFDPKAERKLYSLSRYAAASGPKMTFCVFHSPCSLSGCRKTRRLRPHVVFSETFIHEHIKLHNLKQLLSSCFCLNSIF